MPPSDLAGYGPAEDAEGATPLDGYGPPEPIEGATPISAAPARPTGFVDRLKFAAQHPIESLKDEIPKAYGGAKAVADTFLNTASGGVYHQLRDARSLSEALMGGAPASAETQATDAFNAEHPFIGNAATGAAYLAPGGVPDQIARTVASAGTKIATRLPEAVQKVASRVPAWLAKPAASAATNAATAGATSLAEDIGQGVPLKEALPRAGKSAALGGAVGATLGAGSVALDKLRSGARARATGDIANDIIAAEGKKARVTDQKRVAEVKDRLFELTVEKPELRKVWRESAEKALPEIERVKSEVARPLDSLYKAVDHRTGGGLTLETVTDGLRARADKLASKRSGLEDAGRLRKLADQFEQAYLPKEGTEARPLASGDLNGQIADLEKLRENAKGVSARAIDEQIAGIRSQLPKTAAEIRIPTKQFREEVTALFKTANDVMGGLEGTPRHEALAKLYKAGKEIIDEHLNASGLPRKMLDKLRKANDQYFLLSRAEAAIESRGWKERDHGGLKLVHTAHQAIHSPAGLAGVAGTAGYLAMHPHAIPYVAGSLALAKGLPAVASRANWALASTPFAGKPLPTGLGGELAAGKERNQQQRAASSVARLLAAARGGAAPDDLRTQGAALGLPDEVVEKIARTVPEPQP